MRVLLIESDSGAAASIELMLKSEGVNADTTGLGEEAINLARLYDCDVIVCEMYLMDMPGMDVLRSLRNAAIKTPLIFLTSYKDNETEAAALDAGADDYITKPFHKDNLLARLRAVVRRSHGHTSSKLTVGGLTLNLADKSVAVNGEALHLTRKEYDLLELLMRRKESTLTKEVILTHMYGGMDEPELKIVDVFICKLRGRLEAAGLPDHIQTAWGRGYRFEENPVARTRQRTNGGKPSLRASGRTVILQTLEAARRPMTLPEIAMVADLKFSTVQGTMSSVVRKELIERRPFRDRHRTYAITPKGAAFLKQNGFLNETIVAQ